IYEDIELKAAFIELDLGDRIVSAVGLADSTGKVIGSPEFKDGKDEFKSKELKYNFETKKGYITEVFSEQNGGYLHSRITKMQANKEIHLKDGKYTTCNLEHPHFYIALTKAKVIPDDKIVSGPAYLVVEDIPVPLGIPFGFFPNKSGHTSGIIIPEYGEEENRGFFLRNGGYYFAINDYVDLEVRGDIYSKGSWGLNTLSRYRVRYKFNGNLNLKFSSMKLYEDEPGDRMFWLKWNHNQDTKARPYSRFSANVDFGSSSYNRFNTTNVNTRLKNEMSSSISYNLSIPNTPFSMSTNIRHTQNTQDSTVSLSIPDLAINMSRIYPLKWGNKVGKTRWYEKIGMTYTTNFKNSVSVHEDTLFSKEVVNYFKNGIIHKIPVSTSMKVLKFFTLNPSFSYTERWYMKSILKTFTGFDTNNVYTTFVDTLDGFRRASDYLINIPFTTKLYGFFMSRNPDSYFQALRHMVTPTIGYSFRPDFSKEHFNYYRYVTNGSDTLEMYSVFNGGAGHWSGIFGSPPSGKYGAINFRLGNNLELKVKSKKDTTETKRPPIKLIDDLSFSTNYNLAADSIKWSNLNISARTRVNILNLSFSANMNPYANDTLGRSVDILRHKQGNSWFRLQSANFSAGFSLRSSSTDKKQKEKEDAKIEAARAAGLLGNYYEDYVDFDIPWDVRIDYSLVYSQPRYLTEERKFEEKITQTIRFSGELNLTEKWKISMSSGYDMETKDFTYTTVDIYRDLHCWEMSFNWIPFGSWKSYNFTIKVKSAMLQDLKLNRRRSWTDNF
ncbi:MAG: putative LPS assembly protein LptD, partial [Bacteroidota bacterium]